MSSSNTIMQELSVDKSLLAVYRHSRSYSESRLDFVIRALTILILICLSILLWITKFDLFPLASKSITNWLNIGFTYATTILGFLVAGFTIFSTMTRTEIFIALAGSAHKTLGVSQLKFIFYSFLRVFVLHIVLIFFCVVVIMLKDSSGIYLSVLNGPNISISIKKVGISLVLPCLGYLIMSTLLHLKTFVWNLYQSIIIAVAGAAAIYELERANHRNVTQMSSEHTPASPANCSVHVTPLVGPPDPVVDQ